MWKRPVLTMAWLAAASSRLSCSAQVCDGVMQALRKQLAQLLLERVFSFRQLNTVCWSARNFFSFTTLTSRAPLFTRLVATLLHFRFTLRLLHVPAAPVEPHRSALESAKLRNSFRAFRHPPLPHSSR